MLSNESGDTHYDNVLQLFQDLSSDGDDDDEFANTNQGMIFHEESSISPSMYPVRSPPFSISSISHDMRTSSDNNHNIHAAQ